MSTPEEKKAADEGRVEVSVGGNSRTASGEFGGQQEKPEITQTGDSETGLGIDFNNDGSTTRTGVKGLEAGEGGEGEDLEEGAPGAEAEAAEAAAKEAAEKEAAEGDEDKEEGAEEEASPDADPGEFKADDPEVVARFNERYWNKDEETGEYTELNLTAFNPELEASLAAVAAGKAEKADISKGARDYLKTTLGLSDAIIDNHIQGVIAVRDKQDEVFYGTVGGKEAYDAMYNWAKGAGEGSEPGYTEAQKKRFNAAMESGDPDAVKEQLDLLKMRFQQAGNKVPGVKREAGGEESALKFGRPKRPASPARSATERAGGSASGPKPFESAEEHRKAQDAAMKSGDKKQIEEVRARLKASPKLWKGGTLSLTPRPH